MLKNSKNFLNKVATKLFENFEIKNATTDKYSLIYALYYK